MWVAERSPSGGKSQYRGPNNVQSLAGWSVLRGISSRVVDGKR